MSYIDPVTCELHNAKNFALQVLDVSSSNEAVNTVRCFSWYVQSCSPIQTLNDWQCLSYAWKPFSTHARSSVSTPDTARHGHWLKWSKAEATKVKIMEAGTLFSHPPRNQIMICIVPRISITSCVCRGHHLRHCANMP